MPEPVGCPSCGHMIDDADGVCAVCGFTVRASAAAPVDTAVDAAADVAVDGSAGSTAERRGPAGWAPQAPSRPPRISAPAPVGPPPSQISVDGLGLRWSSRLPRRPVRAAAAAAAAVAVAGGASVSAGGSTSAPARLAAGRSAPAATQGAARRSPGAAVAHAAARARERQRELSRAAAARVNVPARFDQVLGSDFRGDSAISGAGSGDAPPAVTSPPPQASRWAPSGASTIAFPSWWRGSSPVATQAVAGPSASRGRPPVPRIGVVIGILGLAFAALVIFTGLARHWAVQPQDHSQPLQIVPVSTPMPGDLAAVQWELARLTAVMALPAAPVAAPRPAAAARARALRARLVTWRDRFALTAHQTRVLDNAVVYARALGRWLTAPGEPGRHAAALSAWRAWRTDDPLLRNP